MVLMPSSLLALVALLMTYIDHAASQGNVTEGLAPCAVRCFNQASAYSGCTEEDTESAIGCTCFSPKFQQSIQACVSTTCDEAASLQLLQQATQLCAAVGGTPVDNAIAISTLATQPSAAQLYSSFASVNLASSKLAIASSAALENSVDLAIGTAAAASVLRTLNATSMPIRTSMPTGTIGNTNVTGTGAAPFATFTGAAVGRGLGMGRGPVPFVALGAALCLLI